MLKLLTACEYNRIDLLGAFFVGCLWISERWIAGIIAFLVFTFISAMLEKAVKFKDAPKQ